MSSFLTGKVTSARFSDNGLVVPANRDIILENINGYLVAMTFYPQSFQCKFYNMTSWTDWSVNWI